MRPSYLKNAALLTGADVVLRLAGMGLRIWLANALGGEGMGLYQLVLAVYSLFVTLATSGVSVAATRRCCWAALRGRGSLVWRSWPQRGGWAMSAPPVRCGRRHSACPGWRSLRCCAAFSLPGGRSAPTW